jgi:hypothetical protein
MALEAMAPLMRLRCGRDVRRLVSWLGRDNAIDIFAVEKVREWEKETERARGKVREKASDKSELYSNEISKTL